MNLYNPYPRYLCYSKKYIKPILLIDKTDNLNGTYKIDTYKKKTY